MNSLQLCSFELRCHGFNLHYDKALSKPWIFEATSGVHEGTTWKYEFFMELLTNHGLQDLEHYVVSDVMYQVPGCSERVMYCEARGWMMTPSSSQMFEFGLLKGVVVRWMLTRIRSLLEKPQGVSDESILEQVYSLEAAIAGYDSISSEAPSFREIWKQV